MKRSSLQIKDRRRFLRLLAASPLLALPGRAHFLLQELLASGHAGTKDALTLFESLEQGETLITSAEQAFDVMDFEPVARKNLPPAHFGFLATGVDDDATVRANREGFTKLQIRSRRLVDVSNIDMSVRLFGTS